MRLFKQKPTILADDATENVGLLLRLRLPWLFAGLIGGAIITVFISVYEPLLQSKIELAFFIPLIVYMSGAVAVQTETIFVRSLTKKKIHYLIYFIKEFFLGLVIGFALGLATGIFALVWFDDATIAWTVGLAMAASCASATVLALLPPIFLYQEHTDPALGAGPFTTVIQDFVSVLIYFLIASAILFK